MIEKKQHNLNTLEKKNRSMPVIIYMYLVQKTRKQMEYCFTVNEDRQFANTLGLSVLDLDFRAYQKDRFMFGDYSIHQIQPHLRKYLVARANPYFCTKEECLMAMKKLAKTPKPFMDEFMSYQNAHLRRNSNDISLSSSSEEEEEEEEMDEEEDDFFVSDDEGDSIFSSSSIEEEEDEDEEWIPPQRNGKKTPITRPKRNIKKSWKIVEDEEMESEQKSKKKAPIVVDEDEPEPIQRLKKKSPIVEDEEEDMMCDIRKDDQERFSKQSAIIVVESSENEHEKCRQVLENLTLQKKIELPLWSKMDETWKELGHIWQNEMKLWDRNDLIRNMEQLHYEMKSLLFHMKEDV